ncbi:Ig-like domain-containing protein [Luteolibacter marinus]|uniref:Ig-like domain-containing protein n=1 Tax=Luteolibacter marinus TaxID=2776705 RepID=UPI001867BB24|nr:Ig-like domain-containing protein [Luteolibacter marinus]
MSQPTPGTARCCALISLLPLAASAAEFGTLKVNQLANNNQNLASATPGISIVAGPGGTPGAMVQDTANRGDYNLGFGRTNDAGSGVLLSSIAQGTRDDSETGGPAPGEFFATSSLGIDAAGESCWIAIHWAEVADNLEANYDVSYAYLPYDEFPGGVATNTANNAALTVFTGSPALAGGFSDPEDSAGKYQLDLSPLGGTPSSEGVLLVTGGKNEDNFALSRANPDGTFSLFCHDNGSNGRSYENDGVGFSYLATSSVGTHGLAALGRVNGDATADVAAGDFSVTKGPKGRWFLSIPGQSAATGTLIVSPEGGDTNNVDNILSAAWDEIAGHWIIESRDLTGVAPQVPALQDMARPDEDAFSFAFFQAGGAPPAISATAPADGAIRVPVDAPLSVAVTGSAGDDLEVTYYGRRVAAADPADRFTVVALPDTQFYSENKGGDRAAIFSAQTDWIVAERDARNIGFVLHLGDITQHGDNPDTAADEWANACAAMYRLEDPLATMSAEGIPYIVAVGNHDQTPIGDADGTTTYFNTFFGVHPQTGLNHFDGKSYYGDTSEPGSADNHYTLFTAGGLDFIVISLEYDTSPDAADLAWADSLLKAFPARRGIVITHYLVRDGFPAPFSTQGQAIHDALKGNPNLILMHGGHIHGEGRRSDSFNGHTVHSLLADFQGRSNGGDGWLRLMTFHPSQDRIDIESYSPVLDQFETDDDSRFSLDVDLSGGMGPFTEIGRTRPSSGASSITWSGLEAGTRYEWYATVRNGSLSTSTPLQGFVTDGVLFEPTVGITAPANGAIHAQPAEITLKAEAADLDGFVVKVEFYSGTEWLGTDTTAPFSFKWNNVPTGSYTVIAKAIDDDGQVASSPPVSVQVVTEPAAPEVSTLTSGLFNPGWAVAATTPAPLGFDTPGSNPGDVALKINGSAVRFDQGIVAVTNWENPGNGGVDSVDNLCLAYPSEAGNAYLNVLDNAAPNASDANPVTSEESAGVAAAFFPYAAGWIGASVTAEALVTSGNLPAGATVRRTGDGHYAISGLALTGNFLAFANGNTGTDGDNIVSVRRAASHWLVEVRDNSSKPQNGAFSFVYLPAATPGVASGVIAADGSVEPLNQQLATLGAQVTRSNGYFELTIGDGTRINPANSALFLTGDATGSLAAADNINSYSSSGNAFRIFSQDLPNLSGTFQAIDLRFVAIPFDLADASPPLVTVEASDPAGGEFGDDLEVAFTVSRGGSLAAPLHVAYVTGGSAIAGIDYVSLPGFIEIPAGSSSARIAASILPDQTLEGPESITLSLIDGDLYDLGAPREAVATIDDRPLQAFLHAGGLTSPEADDDGDGLANVLEYYLGSDAADAAQRPPLQAARHPDGSYRVRFPHALAAGDLQADIEWSLDLNHWRRSGQQEGEITGIITLSVVSPAGDDPETLEARLTLTGRTLEGPVFMRLAVAP